MAQMLAPYNNSMRLGQGFNSYTQQICLDKAVLPDTEYNRKLAAIRAAKKTVPLSGAIQDGRSGQSLEDKSVQSMNTPTESENDPASDESDEDSSETSGKKKKKPVQVLPWVKPQIVTYSSRFVDKLSDVTDAMNISGSLSIKTATIGGKANGSYVDSDKFKSSDINFHLQVKVTNQIHDADNYNVFNKIENLDASKFPEVYGDSFISGWEEGGELNAIISIKVMNKAKIFEIKAGLEAEMTTPSVSGKVEGKFEMAKNKSSSETETTIAVNWSGGGSIKHPDEDWTINSLKKAAAAFPDLVAITPQRTYAILTKYSALASFHQQNQHFSPLDYENAGIYTGSLLDHYMDYKCLWKQISQATWDLEANRATIEIAQASEDIYRLAKIKPLPSKEADVRFASMKSLTDGKETKADQTKQLVPNQQQSSEPNGNEDDDEAHDFVAFPPSFAGLIEARKVCRFEMSKIVNEVDLVAKNPKLSTDKRRDAYFLHPLVFKQLLPIVRSQSPENAILGVKDPQAAVILGYLPPKEHSGTQTPVHKLEAPLGEHLLDIQQSILNVGHKASNYRIQGCAGAVKTAHSFAEVSNDLEKLDPTYRPVKISAWVADGLLKGVDVKYSSGKNFSHGDCRDQPTHWLQLADDGSEIIVEVVVAEGVSASGAPVIISLKLATSACNYLDTTKEMEQPPLEKVDKKEADVSSGTDTSEKPKETDYDKSKDADKTETSQGSTDAPKAPTTTEEPKKLDLPKGTKTHIWTSPDDGLWSLRGLFSLSFNTRLLSLAVIWGKDDFVPTPSVRISAPLCKNFLSLCPSLQESIKRIKLLKNARKISENSVLGASVATSIEANAASEVRLQHFNPVETLDIAARIKVIGFSSKDNKLTGLKVIYHNGEEINYGLWNDADEKWRCHVKSDLVMAKITAGALDDTSPAYVDTLEFVRADAEGQLPTWPLDLSTVRYLGESDTRVSKKLSSVIEQAPKIGNVRCSVRGFYGEHNGEYITRLGVVWGRG